MTAETRLLMFVKPGIYSLLAAGEVMHEGVDYLEIELADRTFLEVRSDE